MTMANNHMNVVSDFPKIKLSYETFMHKKVFDANVVMAIPVGKKCFAWFTTKNDKNVCYILEIGGEKQIERVQLVTTCFHPSLSIGTILYGTISFYEKRRFFTMEDIMYYKGKNVQPFPYVEKLGLFDAMFMNDLKQVSYTASFVTFGLPMMSSDANTLVRQISQTQRMMYFQYRYFNKPLIYRVKSYIVMQPDNLLVPAQNTAQAVEPEVKQIILPQPPPNVRVHMRVNTTYKPQPVYERIFCVTPDIQNDIYHLSDPVEKSLIGLAYIPDYKTSVMMNQLFRNIKENFNLDSLEESDSEDEFEDDRVDKFVYLDREYNMICAYNHKFKKWVPLRVVEHAIK